MIRLLPQDACCQWLRLPRNSNSVLRLRKRPISSKHSTTKDHDVLSKQRHVPSTRTIALASTVVLSGAISWYTRHWRNQQLEKLEFYDPNKDDAQESLPRPPEEILRTVERAGLMGKPGAKSVKGELEDIRKWHTQRGYKGGLVLRELLQPLFEHSNDKADYGPQTADGITLQDLTHPNLARRECYYMYYEITPNGEIKHEIFCRGTTLTIDVWTSLTTWMEYDEELDCRVHMGFNRQAAHILEDILPLMAPPGPRTTVRISGHSLGGAVAFLLAAKLKRKGYRVTQVTGVEAPRLCATKDSAERLQSLLPPDTLRIENDLDPVPLLPPFGHPVGNKLYLVDAIGKVAYLPSRDAPTNGTRWTDSVFVNARLWEILTSKGRAHRILYIGPQIKKAFGLVKEEE